MQQTQHLQYGFKNIGKRVSMWYPWCSGKSTCVSNMHVGTCTLENDFKITITAVPLQWRKTHAVAFGKFAISVEVARSIRPRPNFVDFENLVAKINFKWRTSGEMLSAPNCKWNTRCTSKLPGLYKKNKKLIFFCKRFIGRNSLLRTEYNDLHDQEDYRMTLLGHPPVWHWVWRSKSFE